jgi:hypothetical protein
MKDPALLWIVRPLRRLVADRRIRLTTAVAASLICLTGVVAAAGTHEVSLTVSDGKASDTRSEPLTVAPVVQSPQCGDTITTSIRLRTDLICLGDGLIVGADDIVIDLGGHTVMADRAGAPDSVGIEDGERHRNVTIRNGTIRNFTVGVRLNGSQAPGRPSGARHAGRGIGRVHGDWARAFQHDRDHCPGLHNHDQ